MRGACPLGWSFDGVPTENSIRLVKLHDGILPSLPNVTVTCLGADDGSMRQTNRGYTPSQAEVSPRWAALRRAAVVPVMEAADLRNGDDSPVTWGHHGSWFGRVLLKREVRS